MGFNMALNEAGSEGLYRGLTAALGKGRCRRVQNYPPPSLGWLTTLE